MAGQGLRLLISTFLRLLALPITTYALLTLSGLDFSFLHKGVLCCVAVILESMARSFILKYKLKREMDRHGAQPLPRVVSKWPFGIDLLLAMMEEERSGYLGYHLTGLIEEMGRTFLIGSIGDSQVFYGFLAVYMMFNLEFL